MFEVSVDDIRKVYFKGDEFPEDDIAAIEYLRDLVVEEVRILISNADRDLEEEILEGKLSALIVKNVVSSVIKRTYASNTAGAGMENVAQAAQAAGPYSFSVTPVKSEYSVYFKKDEKRKLGIKDYSLKSYSSI